MANTVLPYNKMIDMVDKKLESIKKLYYDECEVLFEKAKEEALKKKPKKFLWLFPSTPILNIQDESSVHNYLARIDKEIVERSVYNDECKKHLEFRTLVDTKTVKWVEELNRITNISSNLKLAIENQVEYFLTDQEADYLNRLV